ncbi:MAG: LrgB family protein [Bacilli bacterium]
MWNEFIQDPLFGITLTIIAYAISLLLHHRWKFIHPLLLTTILLIGFLLVSEIPYQDYAEGGDLLTLLLGPATIALGVPFYKYYQHYRKSARAIVISVTIGSISGIMVASISIWLMTSNHELVMSMLPKSTTTPIALELARQLGGRPELAAVFAVLTGLIGSVFGPRFLRMVGIRNGLPLGIAMGTSSHGIGTARVIRESQFVGGASGLAMALTGIITSILVIPLVWWFN